MCTKSPVLAAVSLPAWGDGSGSGPGSWIGYESGGNQATGPSSAVAAGASNLASQQGAFVGAGTANQANGISSLVIGGFDNHAEAIDSLVGAGAGNRATGVRSVVVGGSYNKASGPWSFIGGGGRQTGSGAAGTNDEDNVAESYFSTIGGGQGNRAGNSYATVAGGAFNLATRFASTVAGGYINIASGFASTVAGGDGNTASGDYSMVAGGVGNSASGAFSLAAGAGAEAIGDGSFAIADGSTGLLWPVAVNNSFGARYTGGFTFATSVNGTTGLYTTGCQLFGGSGIWACTSDRATKTAFDVIDSRSILQRVADMPITRWRFQGEPEGVRHIGPMAQDFRAAFGLGQDDKSISMLDGQAVALAAIQGLNAKVEEQLAVKDAEIARLREELAELRNAVVVLTARTSVGGRVAQAR